MSSFLESVHERVAGSGRRIAFPELQDDRTRDAIKQLQTRALVETIPVDNPQNDPRFEQYVETYYTLRKHKGMSVDGARDAMRNPLFFAAMMVRHGDADGCVAGAVNTTADVLRAAIHCVGPAPGIRSISSAFYMVVPPFRGTHSEVITFTDGSVIPEPSDDDLVDIAEAAAIARGKIVGDEPRVAFLSFSTHGSADSDSTRKVRSAAAKFRERRPDIASDGEVQADAALIGDVARRKAPDSPLAGTANVLVFPNLDAGNIAYKLVQRLAGAEAVGPILQGLAKPCNDLSRGASADDILNVACITALQATQRSEQKLPPVGAAEPK